MTRPRTSRPSMATFWLFYLIVITAMVIVTILAVSIAGGS